MNSYNEFDEINYTHLLNLKEGGKIDNFKIIKLLGKGGMGAVYLAEDEYTKRKVAIKIITQIHNKKEVDRFIEEAKIVAKLRHKNIVRIFTIKEIGNMPYIVMEYVQGIPLNKFLKENKLELNDIVTIFIKIAQVLKYVHSKKIIHRDIKPQNILIKKDKEPVLMDFGIGKILDKNKNKELTKTGEILGTPQYMSPEQAQGKKDIDYRADIYSYGAILYEIITKKPLFDTDNVWELMHKIISSKPILPTKINKDIPKELEYIILKCLKKDRKKRYQNFNEVIKDLKSFILKRENLKKKILYKKLVKGGAFSISLILILIILFLIFNNKEIKSGIYLKEFERYKYLEDSFKLNKKSVVKLKDIKRYINILESVNNEEEIIRYYKKIEEIAKKKKSKEILNFVLKKEGEFLLSIRKYIQSYRIFNLLLKNDIKKDEKLKIYLYQAECIYYLKDYDKIEKIKYLYDNKYGKNIKEILKNNEDIYKFYFFKAALKLLKIREEIKRELFKFIKEDKRIRVNKGIKGKIEENIKILEKAKKYYKKEYKLNYQSYLLYGYSLTNKYKEAEKIIKREKEIIEKEKIGIEGGMIYYYKIGDYKKAKEYISKNINREPWNYLYYYYRGNIISQIILKSKNIKPKEYEKLLEDLFTSIELFPNFISLLEVLSKILFKKALLIEFYYSYITLIHYIKKIEDINYDFFINYEINKLKGKYIRNPLTKKIIRKKINEKEIKSLIKNYIKYYKKGGKIIEKVLEDYWYDKRILKNIRYYAKKKKEIKKLKKLEKKIKKKRDKYIKEIIKYYLVKYFPLLRKEYIKFPILDKKEINTLKDILNLKEINEKLFLNRFTWEYLKEILNDKKENIYIRLLAGKMLISLRNKECFNYLKNSLYSKDLSTKLITFCLLKDFNYINTLINYKINIIKKQTFKLTNLDSEKLKNFMIVIFNYIGEYIEDKTYLYYFRNSSDIKIRLYCLKYIIKRRLYKKDKICIKKFIIENLKKENYETNIKISLLLIAYDYFPKIYFNYLIKRVLKSNDILMKDILYSYITKKIKKELSLLNKKERKILKNILEKEKIKIIKNRIIYLLSLFREEYNYLLLLIRKNKLSFINKLYTFIRFIQIILEEESIEKKIDKLKNVMFTLFRIILDLEKKLTKNINKISTFDAYLLVSIGKLRNTPQLSLIFNKICEILGKGINLNTKREKKTNKYNFVKICSAYGSGFLKLNKMKRILLKSYKNIKDIEVKKTILSSIINIILNISPEEEKIFYKKVIKKLKSQELKEGASYGYFRYIMEETNLPLLNSSLFNGSYTIEIYQRFIESIKFNLYGIDFGYFFRTPKVKKRIKVHKIINISKNNYNYYKLKEIYKDYKKDYLKHFIEEIEQDIFFLKKRILKLSNNYRYKLYLIYFYKILNKTDKALKILENFKYPYFSEELNNTIKLIEKAQIYIQSNNLNKLNEIKEKLERKVYKLYENTYYKGYFIYNILKVYGQVLILLHKWKEAKEIFTKQTIIAPQFPLPYIFKAYIQIKLNNIQKAQKYLKIASTLIKMKIRKINTISRSSMKLYKIKLYYYKVYSLIDNTKLKDYSNLLPNSGFINYIYYHKIITSLIK